VEQSIWQIAARRRHQTGHHDRFAFADDALAELSRLIGLTGGQSQLHYQDLREDAASTHHLHFAKQPSLLGSASEAQITLRNYFDPDNSRMLLVYPASWPLPLGEHTPSHG
jgi:hypothetical protein